MNLRDYFGELDKELLLLVLILASLGVVNLYSASQSTRPGVQWLQMAYIGVGLVMALGLAALDPSWFERLAYPIYGTVCILLVLVLVAGTTVKGSQRWISLGFLNLQPSELAKLAIVFAVARFFTRGPEQGLLTLRDVLRPLNLSRPLGFTAVLIMRWNEFALPDSPGLTTLIRVAGGTAAVVWIALSLWKGQHLRWAANYFVAPIDVIALPSVLILIEPDLGTTLIVAAIAASIVLVVGMQPRSLVISAVVGVLGAVAAWFEVLKPYQKRRVLTFLNPEADALGAGYHANQSMIAIGSGGLEGKGFMGGTQTQLSFLPENHTDFVFSVLAEEWGLLGGIVVLVVFALLLTKGLRIAAEAQSRFSALVAVGVTGVIFWQMLVNIGMVTGLMPVVGVTLPLLSYGGSSVLTVMLGVGVWLSIARQSPRY